MGVMKAVGEAVREGQSLQLNDQRVCHSLRLLKKNIILCLIFVKKERFRCVGVGHWGYVKKRESLIAHQSLKEKVKNEINGL